MSRKYILVNGEPTLEPDLIKWAKWFDAATAEDRVVRQEDVFPGVEVSTCFISMDHSFRDDGPPLIYETMVFGGPLDGQQDRYTTRTEAEAGHRAMVARGRGSTADGQAMSKTVLSVLTDARARLALPGGWVPGKINILRALRDAADGDIELTETAGDILRQVIGQESILLWDGEEGRTQAEVLAALDRAIVLVEGSAI